MGPDGPLRVVDNIGGAWDGAQLKHTESWYAPLKWNIIIFYILIALLHSPPFWQERIPWTGVCWAYNATGAIHRWGTVCSVSRWECWYYIHCRPCQTKTSAQNPMESQSDNKHIKTNKYTSVEEQALIALILYAAGTFYKVVAENIGVEKSTTALTSWATSPHILIML